MAKKILIVGNAFVTFDGVVTFTHTLTKGLANLGHTVDQLVFHHHDMSHLFEPYGQVFVGPNWREKEFVFPEDDYDLVIANFNWHWDVIGHLNCPKIQVSHGSFSKWDTFHPNFEHRVCLSYANQEFFGAGEVIHHPVDTERFSCELQLNKIPSVYCFARSDRTNDLVKKACDRLGWGFDRFNDHDKSRVWDTYALYRYHDIVVSIGRSVYESMSCAKAAFIFDTRDPYYTLHDKARTFIEKETNGEEYQYLTYSDGYVTPNTSFGQLHEYAGSGRKFKHDLTCDVELADVLDTYNQSMGEYNRNFIINHHDMNHIAQQYIDLIE